MSTAMTAATLSELAKALDELRRERGLSYARLGRKAQGVPGISRTSAHAVITGRRDLDLVLLRGFLVVCDVSSEERLRWLGAFDRLTRAAAAEPEILIPATLSAAPVMPRDPAPPAPTYVDPQPPHHHTAWPTLEDVRRAYPRRPRPIPDHVHRHLPWLLVPAVGAPLCAILMTRHAIPVPTILGFLVMATVGLALWTIHLPGVGAGRRLEKPYVRKIELVDDSEAFRVDRLAAPPVIGL
ncbi:helix-turn-helix domain-containing protein [Saccharothrix texasensis]|uniref:Helix-turn-helix protein n=1 Tax=Saccharothrix texasensis TaxID=103734 RepID=A0A3N1GZH9_9PSEU|nr:helix-turn-helix transcriptional regulator [Saccharothrix texasensis]ROP35372.1 hypothetical protein EDD40_0598 [Saccharothrix texasensis]